MHNIFSCYIENVGSDTQPYNLQHANIQYKLKYTPETEVVSGLFMRQSDRTHSECLRARALCLADGYRTAVVATTAILRWLLAIPLLVSWP